MGKASPAFHINMNKNQMVLLIAYVCVYWCRKSVLHALKEEYGWWGGRGNNVGGFVMGFDKSCCCWKMIYLKIYQHFWIKQKNKTKNIALERLFALFESKFLINRTDMILCMSGFYSFIWAPCVTVLAACWFLEVTLYTRVFSSFFFPHSYICF